MFRRLSTLVLILTLAGNTSLDAQPNPNYTLHIPDQVGTPGETIEVPILLDFDGDFDIAGWQYGVCHDASRINILDVFMGATTQIVRGGNPPDFYVAQAFLGEGFHTGVVINLSLPFINLPPGENYELNTATYRLVGPQGEKTELVFCDTIGNPVVATFIITPQGTTLVPTQEPSNIQIDLSMFLRGDADGNASFNGLADGLYALRFQFLAGSPPPPCMDAADANDDGSFSGIVDGIYCLNFQFVGGSPPPPSPGPFVCGPDATNDPLECAVSCP